MERPRVVFTGITGLLGGYFLKQRESEYKIVGVGNRNILEPVDNFFKLDITRKGDVLDFIQKINPSIIVHGAAIGNVDYCEKNPEEAQEVNVGGTINLIEAAKLVDARLIFLSTNAVYNGNNPPYSETSPANPIDVYGKTKVEGEGLVRNSNLDFSILRLMTMYGWPQPGGRSNPVTWVIDNLKRGERINVVSDIYNNHLWAGQAAEVIWKVIKDIKTVSETYNISGDDSISRYELALKVAEVFELDATLINSVTSDFFKELVKRPKNTSFNPLKQERELGIKPLTVDEGLRLMRQEQMSKLIRPT